MNDNTTPELDDEQTRSGLGGPTMERRYWLTDKGWAAVGGRSA